MAEKQYASFYLDQAAFGLDILCVTEINRHLDITPVDRAPGHVRGLLNLRGQIVTVIDLGVRLGLDARNISRQSRCLILKSSRDNRPTPEHGGEDVVGLLVDRVGDVVPVEDSQIEPPPANVGAIDTRFMRGIVKLPDQLLVVLDLSKILTLQ